MKMNVDVCSCMYPPNLDVLEDLAFHAQNLPRFLIAGIDLRRWPHCSDFPISRCVWDQSGFSI